VANEGKGYVGFGQKVGNRYRGMEDSGEERPTVPTLCGFGRPGRLPVVMVGGYDEGARYGRRE